MTSLIEPDNISENVVLTLETSLNHCIEIIDKYGLWNNVFRLIKFNHYEDLTDNELVFLAKRRSNKILPEFAAPFYYVALINKVYNPQIYEKNIKKISCHVDEMYGNLEIIEGWQDA